MQSKAICYGRVTRGTHVIRHTQSTAAAFLLLTLAVTATSTRAQNIDLSIPSSNIPLISGFSHNSTTGPFLWPAGDINKDGYSDMLIGSSYHQVAGDTVPRGNLVLGSTTFSNLDINEFSTSTLRGAYCWKPGPGLLLGELMAAAGDFNNDGYDDFLVNELSNTSWLVYGSQSPLSNLNVSTLDSSNLKGFKINGRCNRIAGIGDINNDGYDDIAISNMQFDATDQGSQEGRVYVIYGRSNATNITLSTFVSSPQNGFTLTGYARGNKLGRLIGSAGDFNNDGIDDMYVGNLSTSVNEVGQGCPTFVIKGRTGGYTDIDYGLTWPVLPPENSFAILGNVASQSPDRSPGARSITSDFNGDGFSDLVLIGGAAYVIYGRDDSTTYTLLSDLDTPTTGGFRINGIAGEVFGSSWAWAGDVNNDNLADIIINARNANHNGLTNSGSTYVIYGKTTVTQTIDLANNFTFGQDGYRIDGARADPPYPMFPVVSAAGDINNDGYDDFLVGAPFHTNGVAGNRGEAYLIYGKSSNNAGIQNWMKW